MTHFASFVKWKLENYQIEHKMTEFETVDRTLKNALFHETIIKYHPIHYYYCQHKNLMVTAVAHVKHPFMIYCYYFCLYANYGLLLINMYDVRLKFGIRMDLRIGYDFTFALFEFQFSRMKSEKKEEERWPLFKLPQKVFCRYFLFLEKFAFL